MFRVSGEMVSESVWKRIWLFFGVLFILIVVFMIFGSPALASVTGTAPFSDRARAMISFLWIWILIHNGIGHLFIYQDMEKNEVLLKLGVPAGLTFMILQSIYVAIGYFEFGSFRNVLDSYFLNLDDYYSHLSPYKMKSSLISPNL